MRAISNIGRLLTRSLFFQPFPSSCGRERPLIGPQILIRHFGVGKIPESMMNAPIDRIRNVGIMAHIDAGKTTSTERMLYTAGVTDYAGGVDRGDTVMDYMDQERERGITITSAAISFPWNDYRLNFIDTPGHVDFTVEVERSLRVLDGAVAVYDAAKGIEAQSVTVWRQAQRYDVPCIALINKMDRANASATKTLGHMEEKLNTCPIVMQLPVGIGASFKGVVDLLELKLMTWPGKLDCRDYTVENLATLSDQKDLLERALEARQELFEKLAESDETFMEYYLEVGGEAASVDLEKARAALRRATISRVALPVFYGAALRNRGMEPVLDAMTHYLPAPHELKKNAVPDYAKEFCAFVFKITHDKRRGPLVFMRIFSGEISTTMELYNVNRRCVERASRVILISANEYLEVASIGSGNIAVAVGLKEAVTGDTLIARAAGSVNARMAKAKKGVEKASKSKDSKPKESTEADGADQVSLPGIKVPEPVFFCTVEVRSSTEEEGLDHGLACLCREDPSLRVSTTDQQETVLSGMGELHLEIVKDRLLREYKTKAIFGKPHVAYRETFAKPFRYLVDRAFTHAGRTFQVKAELEISRAGEDPVQEDAMNILQKFTCAKTPEISAYFIPPRGEKKLSIIRKGLESACLSVGPLIQCPLRCVAVHMTQLECKVFAPPELVMLAVETCFLEALQHAEIQLIEPVMELQIALPPSHFSTVLGDLTGNRRGTMDNMLEDDIDGHVIYAHAPLEALMGYSTYIRRQTSGLANLSMQLAHYASVPSDAQEKAVKSLTFSYDGGDVL